MPETKQAGPPAQRQSTGTASAGDPVEARLARQVAELTGQVGTAEADYALASLRVLEEDWARHALGVDKSGSLAGQARRCVESRAPLGDLERALPHASRAVQWQWALSSFATGASEGLAIMAEVRQLQTALAWLHAGIAQHDPLRATRHVSEARRIAREVQDDSKAGARYYAASLLALEALLAGLGEAAGAPPQRH